MRKKDMEDNIWYCEGKRKMRYYPNIIGVNDNG